MTRCLGRLIVALMVGALAGTMVATISARPAAAHSAVTVDPAVAGASNAIITINAEAESDKAGIVSLRVILPDGLAPGDVAYVDGPAGWSLAVESDGYVVSGPALSVGRNARHRVRARALPMVPSLAFRILQTYTDGRVDRWIEMPSQANPQPDNPAPVVTLAAPPGGFPSLASPSASPQSTASGQADVPIGEPAASASGAADRGTPTAVAIENDDPGTSALPWLGGAIAIVCALALGVWLVRRRRVAATESDAS